MSFLVPALSTRNRVQQAKIHQKHRISRIDLSELSMRQFFIFYADLIKAHIREPKVVPLPTSIQKEPPVKLDYYLRRLVQQADAPKECFINSIILLRRFFKYNKHQNLTWFNVYRLSLISLIVSSKMLEDRCFTLEDWNRIALGFYGVNGLSSLEGQFLKLIHWNVLVTQTQFDRLLSNVHVADIFGSIVYGWDIVGNISIDSTDYSFHEEVTAM